MKLRGCFFEKEHEYVYFLWDFFWKKSTFSVTYKSTSL